MVMTDEELLAVVYRIRNLMISVSTGGPRIQEVNDEFLAEVDTMSRELSQRRIDNPLPYSDLWVWHGKWSSGDLPTYASRRVYITELFEPLIRQIKTGNSSEYEPTGWARVDRTVSELRRRLSEANSEEHYQAIGLLCREALISTAQAVFDPEQHPTLDGVKASETDAKRMLESYIAVALAGGSNDFLRKHVRAALDLAIHVQHRRTASYRDAAICLEATISVVNIIAIVAGLRTPKI